MRSAAGWPHMRIHTDDRNCRNVSHQHIVAAPLMSNDNEIFRTHTHTLFSRTRTATEKATATSYQLSVLFSIIWSHRRASEKQQQPPHGAVGSLLHRSRAHCRTSHNVTIATNTGSTKPLLAPRGAQHKEPASTAAAAIKDGWRTAGERPLEALPDFAAIRMQLIRMGPLGA